MIRTTLAPAKVNLFLHVGPPEADGRHGLCSLMVFADIGDQLSLGEAHALELPPQGGPHDAAIRQLQVHPLTVPLDEGRLRQVHPGTGVRESQQCLGIMGFDARLQALGLPLTPLALPAPFPRVGNVLRRTFGSRLKGVDQIEGIRADGSGRLPQRE